MKKFVLVCVMVVIGINPLWGFWGDTAIILNQIIQINQARKDLSMQLEQLQKLESITESVVQGMGSLSLDTIQQFLNAIYMENEVERLVTEISYDQNQVFKDYEELFPTQSQWREMPQEEQTLYAERWIQELRTSRENALLAQSKVTDYRDILKDILSYSDLEPTTEILIQQTNQILTVISHQLGELALVVATSERAMITEMSVNDFTDPKEYYYSRGEPLDPQYFREQNTPSYVDNTPFSFEGFSGD